MTNIVLLGYGAMGKRIEQLAQAHECWVVGVADTPDERDRLPTTFDVAIDFSVPSAALDNAEWVLGLGKGLVIGTTGWYNNMEQLHTLVSTNNGACVWGSNYSVGAQIFDLIVREASKAVFAAGNYDVALHEVHHTRKLDSPSGTAQTIARNILAEMKNKTSETLQITSTRLGTVVGEHTVMFDSAYDSITLHHSAKNRDGFASGALHAARLITGKQGLFSFSELITQGK